MSSLSTVPKGDSAWLLRKAVQRVMQQVSVLETNIGTSTTGNSANTQVIFNDAGTLRGDPDLIFNTANNRLVALNLEATAALQVGTNATISGALTVDTTTLVVDPTNDRVGIGTATPAAKLIVRDGSNRNLLVSSDATQLGSAGIAIGSFTDNAAGYAPLSIIAGTSMAFGMNGTTAMTLNATGLGIGGSPDAGQQTRLYVYQTGDLTNEVAPFTVGNTAAGGMRLYAGVNNTNEYVYIGSVKSGTGYRSLILQPNGGNVGIGVTPSAWNSSTKVLQVGSIGAVENFNNADFNIGNNFFRNSSNALIYSTTKFATAYLQSAANGTHVWYNAPSGTAGNAITFTQAMTLDASGRLLVGGTGPFGIPNGAGTSFFPLIQTITTSGSAAVSAFVNDGTNNRRIGLFVDNDNGITGISVGRSGGSAPFVYRDATDERLRIDTFGNLITTVPTTPPTLAANSQMVFNLTSNTNLRISVRGTDGVTRTANLTLAP